MAMQCGVLQICGFGRVVMLQIMSIGPKIKWTKTYGVCFWRMSSMVLQQLGSSMTSVIHSMDVSTHVVGNFCLNNCVLPVVPSACGV